MSDYCDYSSSETTITTNNTSNSEINSNITEETCDTDNLLTNFILLNVPVTEENSEKLSSRSCSKESLKSNVSKNKKTEN